MSAKRTSAKPRPDPESKIAGSIGPADSAAWPSVGDQADPMAAHLRQIEALPTLFYRIADGFVQHAGTHDFASIAAHIVVQGQYEILSDKVQKYFDWIDYTSKDDLTRTQLDEIGEKLYSVLEFSRLHYEAINLLSEYYIDDNKAHPDLDEEARWALVDTFAKRNPGEPISAYVKGLFPEKFLEKATRLTPAALDLPTKAPEIYQGLRGPETPPEFVKRVYDPWLGKGLDRAHIRHLDPKLYVAINNWLTRPGNEWPADVDLPKRSEQNRRLVKAGPEVVQEHLGKFTGLEAFREAARIRGIRSRTK